MNQPGQMFGVMRNMVYFMNHRVWHWKNISCKGNSCTVVLPLTVSKHHALCIVLVGHLISQSFCPVGIYVRRNSKPSKIISSSKVKTDTIKRVLPEKSYGSSKFLLIYMSHQNMLVICLELFTSVLRLRIVI